jgi:HSP20 family protein
MSLFSLPRKLRPVRRIELNSRRHDPHAAAVVHDPSGQRGYCQYRPLGSWRPAVNLYESADSYFVGVDLAGMSREAIEVTLTGNVLVISGSREHPRPPDCSADLSIHLMEIEQGPFCRSVEIPSEVDLSAIGARYTRTGYLWVELPKRGR